MADLLRQLEIEENDDIFFQDLKAAEARFVQDSRNGTPSDSSKFDYAFHLVRSSNTTHRNMGKLFLQQLLDKEPNNREYLYFLSIVCFKLEEYKEARFHNDRILSYEPNNRQALDLQKMIQDKVTQEGLTGMLIAGGGVAAVVGLVSVLAFALKKK